MSPVTNEYGFRRNDPKDLVSVTLTCGHTIRVRAKPHRNSRYVCTAQKDCGYRLSWTQRIGADGQIHVNPFHEETDK